jgi:hypothetical protein
VQAARERQRERFAGSERLFGKGDMGVSHARRGTWRRYGRSARWTTRAGAAACCHAAAARHCVVAYTSFVHQGQLLPPEATPWPGNDVLA